MSRTIVANLLALSIGQFGWSATYTVQNTQNAGTGSLRWAISQANDRSGPDMIEFAPALSGQGIEPTKPFPLLLDDETTIDGDIDNDGRPDIVLNGRRLSSGDYGLVVAGDGCDIVGLAIVRFPDVGIFLATAANCSIRSCHIGTNLAGTKERLNDDHQVVLFFAHHNEIGDGTATGRNIIAGGSDANGTSGIMAMSSTGNTIKGNYIGLKRDGMSALGSGGTGIGLYTLLPGVPPGPVPIAIHRERLALTASEQNVIGGTTPGERNLVAGVQTGLAMYWAPSNVIQGNYFGLAQDGNTVLGCNTGVGLMYGSADNLVGGRDAGAGNVFVGGGIGVMIGNEGSEGNKVQGNYFGLNAAGTAQRRLRLGVAVMSRAGPQMIGGNVAMAGNYFTTKPTTDTVGVVLSDGGSGIIIRRNKFGVRPDGTDASPSGSAIRSLSTSAEILDNTIARAQVGIGLEGDPLETTILRNWFRRCDIAVKLIGNTRCLMGDLGNSSAADDGGNVFRAIGTWFIRNETARLVKAEGNDFNSTSRATIDAKILDRKDNPAYGRVDFSPLAGGVLPTGSVLAVTGATALPTPAGAEIAFTLSAPARVSTDVLNIAGRPVATIARDASLEAGLQRMVWSGRSGSGVAAPSGVYLVKVTAHGLEGEQTAAVTALRLQR